MEYLIKLNETAKKEQMNYYEVTVNERIQYKKLEAFEQKHQIVLPSEYKKFILEYANGMSGELFDLLPLEQYDLLYKKSEFYEQYFKNEFQFTDDHPYEPLRKTFMSETEGTITIRKKGTGYDLLVVSGKDYGAVWHTDRKKGFGIKRIASSFRKYIDERIDEQIKTLVDQERFRNTIYKDRIKCIVLDIMKSDKTVDFIILKENTRMKYRISHTRESNFLLDNVDCKQFEQQYSVNLVFIIDNAKYFKEETLRGNYYFEDEWDDDYIKATANVIVRTKLLESHRDGFSNKYYTRCRLNNFDADMYIVTNRNISHLAQKEVSFMGTLGSLIKGINL